MRTARFPKKCRIDYTLTNIDRIRAGQHCWYCTGNAVLRDVQSPPTCSCLTQMTASCIVSERKRKNYARLLLPAVGLHNNTSKRPSGLGHVHFPSLSGVTPEYLRGSSISHATTGVPLKHSNTQPIPVRQTEQRISCNSLLEPFIDRFGAATLGFCKL